MADNDDQNDDREPHLHGFAMRVPEGLIRAMEHEHDRAHMEVESFQQRIFSFFDSLNVEQLMTMRTILNADAKSWANNYFEGQVVTILRLIHGVDPDTGLTAEQALARLNTPPAPDRE
jgi:hypothetical protein